MGRKKRSLLIRNDTTDTDLKLNLYDSSDVVCWMPYTSKVIKQNDLLLCTSKWGCKLELVAWFLTDKKQSTKIILKPQQWIGDRYVRITESLDVIEDDLSNHPEEKKKGLQKNNRDKELENTDGGRNFYSILRLDMDKVRALTKDEQDKAIFRAFLLEIQIWHPDHNEEGDMQIVKELIMAYDVLRDREKRARYNNLVDFDKGWLSGKRFKAVFWPECETPAQRLAWIKRMGLLALSAGLTIAGIVSVVLTAGLSSPLLIGAIAGGVNSLRETVSKEAVLDGCDVKKWLMSTQIGYLLAFLPGGAAIATAALETAAVSVAELMGIRLAIAAGCAIVSSLGNDAKRRFIDGEKITIKQALGHAACQCAAAVAATLAGGAVAKAMRHHYQTPTAASNFEPAVKETHNKVSTAAAGKIGSSLPINVEATVGDVSSAIPANVGASVGEIGSPIPINVEAAVGGIGEQGPSLPDQAKHLVKHIPEALTKGVTRGAIEKAGEIAEKQLEFPETITPLNLPGVVVIEKAVELLENLEDLSSEEENPAGSESSHEVVDIDDNREQENRPKVGVMKYVSDGWWYSGFSEMVVSFLLNGKTFKKKVTGKRKQVKIPGRATQIEVSFKIWRPPWGDILKYDRFKRCWCEPKEPHVFRYPTPVHRTFTTEGTLWWEAVMKVTDEHHNETEDM
ncbi:uncharacterized protein [Montipora foliosa]|uniref:uncharacterized protein n=1 Tax=Montipora foliosa TaxID=591990 RepID=UPI0035F1830E